MTRLLAESLMLAGTLSEGVQHGHILPQYSPGIRKFPVWALVGLVALIIALVVAS